jgi:phospholipid-binding lipoprotein MlaA
MPSRAARLAQAAALLLLALPAAPAAASEDPLEPVNRRIHAFNRFVQANLLGPAADAYHWATTPGIRRGVSNTLGNLNEPMTAVSALAAGEFGRAWNATARFGINSVIGLAGIFDAAEELGFPRRPFAAADAVCHWGVPSGPFLVLPLLGPSTLRDAGTTIAVGAALADVLGADVFLPWRAGDLFVDYARLHPEIGRVEGQALDAYATFRSAYLQRRAAICPADRARLEMAEAEER